MDAFLIGARAVHFAAAIALTGVFAFECLVAGPAFRQFGVAPASAAGLRRRFGWLAWASLALAIGLGAAWLAAVAAGMSGTPLGIALCRDVVPVVLTRTRFGEDWLLGLGLAVLLALCLVARRVLPARATGAVGWAALTLAAVMLASLAWAGHGAATPGAPGDFHLAGDILHLLGVGMWLGTLPPLAFLLAAARRTGDANWAVVTRTATQRYSVLAVASVAILLAGGLINTWFLAGTVPALVGTEYGRLLLAKIGLFIVMLMVAAVNLLRLTPRLAGPAGGVRNAVWRTVARLQGNARIETGLGLAVLAIVGALGILPPGLHTEPGWPFPFRVEIGALTVGSKILLAILAVFIFAFAVAAAAAAAAGLYRRMAPFAAALVLCLAVGWIPLRPAVERAYPTTYYAPAEPYAALSIARGMPLYAENCAICHGETGRGDGPAAASLDTRPADLTAAHLFAHEEGDLFWWVSHGTDNEVMPGFAGVMSAKERWDVINFIRARAAGVLARQVGPKVTIDAAFLVPDFAFEKDGRQRTLGDELKRGPVLLVLFTPPPPMTRLAQLAAARRRFAAAGLAALAVDLGPPAPKPAEGEGPPLVVAVSAEVVSTLALFADADSESELMLDRAGNVRARWTRDGLPDADTLVDDADRVARLAVTLQSHAGHAH